MRNSYNGKFIFGDDGLIGINLGADYCTEHERGLKNIKYILGINSENEFGVERRRATKVNYLNWFENNKYIGFTLFNFYSEENRLAWLPRDGFRYSDEEKSFYAGWSDGGFHIITDKPTKKNKIEKTVERVKKIFEALQSINVVVWLGGGGVFENAGLCIGIADKMPKDIFDMWYKVDKERNDVKVAFENTGIEKFLKDAGKKWFALSPSMVNGQLKVWLNPYEQQKYNCGYFTIDELKLWAKDDGPIMMNKTNK